MRTNTEIISDSFQKKLLTGIESQRMYLLKMIYLPKRPCGSCGKPFAIVDVFPIDAITFSGGSDDHACPHCGKIQHLSWPLFGDHFWTALLDQDQPKTGT